MSAILGIAWLWAKTRGLSLLAMVPGWVWKWGAIAVAVLYFAHWNVERGREMCRAEVQQAAAEERARVEEADRAAIEAAERRAAEAEQVAADRQKEMEDAIEAARRSQQAGNVCLPADVTERLRNIR